MEEREKANLAFFNYAKRRMLIWLLWNFGWLKVWCFDNNVKVTNCPRTGPIIKFRSEALSAEAKDQTGLLTSAGEVHSP